MEKGNYGHYTGNARHSMNHAHTKVTSSNLRASEKDDAAHMDYLKQDINYDAKHGGSDETMTADEKHISKLAGDLKYDKSHHSAATMHGKAHGSMAKMNYDSAMKMGHESPVKKYGKAPLKNLKKGSSSYMSAELKFDPIIHTGTSMGRVVFNRRGNK
jgi:hypothetical protein